MTSKRVFAVILIFVFFSSIGFAEELYFFDFDIGMKILKLEQKTGMVIFDSEHCVYCKKLKEVTFKDQKVVDILNNHYITISLSLDANKTIHYKNQEFNVQTFAAVFKIKGTPTMVFFDEKGDPITLLPGYMPPDKIVPVLEFIGKRLYEKNIKFADYLKNPMDEKFVDSKKPIEISLEDVKFLAENDPFIGVYSFIDFSEKIKGVKFLKIDEFKKSIPTLSKNRKYILIDDDQNRLQELGKDMLSFGFSTILIYNNSNNKTE